MVNWSRAIAAGLLLVGAGTAQASIIISEYVEGSSNNKAIELFNTGATTVDLDDGQFVIQFYSNGNSTPSTTIDLVGTIAPWDTFVLADEDAAAGIISVADQTSGSSFFNGNDAVVLRQGGTSGTILDVIGQVEFNPGTEWGSGLVSTANNTLRRKPTILSGDTNPDDSFDPSVEWIGSAEDTFDGLGSHSVAPEPSSLALWSLLLLSSGLAVRRNKRRR